MMFSTEKLFIELESGTDGSCVMGKALCELLAADCDPVDPAPTLMHSERPVGEASRGSSFVVTRDEDNEDLLDT